VNAGRLAGESWYADAAAHGSRFVGEACHFVDTISWWLGSDPVTVFAAATSDDPDNLVAVFRYADDSVGTVSYLTSGNSRYPKELLEVFGQGAVARFDNFSRAGIWRNGKAKKIRTFMGTDKGQEAEMAAFVDAALTGSPMPIHFESLMATTQATFAAERSAAEGRLVQVLSPLPAPRP
jgi:predicted dehydrogenase